MAICSTKGLSKTYQKDHNLIPAITNCSLEIQAGECVAVCGSKASGKTTLLRILGGLERPTSGDIYFNNQNITAFSDDQLAILRRNEIGCLFHNDSLIAELTIHENIILPSVLARKKYDRNYYQELIHQFNIENFLSLYPKKLTTKQLQLVICARALINNPSIILLDESTKNKEYYMDKEVLDYLVNMVYRKHKTLIMATNDNKNIIFVDHVIKLYEGEVVEDQRIS